MKNRNRPFGRFVSYLATFKKKQLAKSHFHFNSSVVWILPLPSVNRKQRLVGSLWFSTSVFLTEKRIWNNQNWIERWIRLRLTKNHHVFHVTFIFHGFLQVFSRQVMNDSWYNHLLTSGFGFYEMYPKRILSPKKCTNDGEVSHFPRIMAEPTMSPIVFEGLSYCIYCQLIQSSP